MATTNWPHLEERADGCLWLTGTQIKMVEIVLDHLVWKMEATEIVSEYPPLTHSQVHAALGHYYEHRESIEREIEAERERAVELCRDLEDTRLQARLRELEAR